MHTVMHVTGTPGREGWGKDLKSQWPQIPKVIENHVHKSPRLEIHCSEAPGVPVGEDWLQGALRRTPPRLCTIQFGRVLQRVVLGGSKPRKLCTPEAMQQPWQRCLQAGVPGSLLPALLVSLDLGLLCHPARPCEDAGSPTCGCATCHCLLMDVTLT